MPTFAWRPRLAPVLTSPTLAFALELAGVVAILTVAAAVRADAFMLVPRLTDESTEVALGLRLAREGGFPLVGVQPYTGGLFTYLVAAVFLLIGPKIEAGRLLVLTTGVLTVIPTYLLGRALGRSMGGSVTRGRLVGLVSALLLALSGPHITTSSRIAYSNSLTPLFLMTALWLAHRAIGQRSNLALVACGAAFGLALQTHVTALSAGPGIAAAIVLPMIASTRRTGLTAIWPKPDALLTAVGAGLLMVFNLIVYNLTVEPSTVSRTGLRVGRYLEEAGGESPWTLGAWGQRLLGLLHAAALAVGGRTSEVDGMVDALLVPGVVVSVGLALLGLVVAARRGHWLPLFVTVSVLLVVSLLNARVDPIVPRVRHYATLVPLSAVMMAVALAWLYDRVDSWLHGGRGGVWLARAGLVVVPLLLALSSMAAYHAYAAERLSRPDKNNAAYLAVLNAVTRSGSPTERAYLDAALDDLRTLSGGRMTVHLRYAFDVNGQEYDTIDVAGDRVPVGPRATDSRRLILLAESVPIAAARYRLVPLPGEPGESAPLRAFRAYPLRAP